MTDTINRVIKAVAVGVCGDGGAASRCRLSFLCLLARRGEHASQTARNLVGVRFRTNLGKWRLRQHAHKVAAMAFRPSLLLKSHVSPISFTLVDSPAPIAYRDAFILYN